MTNLLAPRRSNGSNIWKGFVFYKLYHDRNGDMFADKCARYVGFFCGVLVGEKHHHKDLEVAFLRGEEDSTCRAENYKGLIEKDKIG